LLEINKFNLILLIIMVTYDYYIMSEESRIIANQGYFGMMYLSHVISAPFN